MKNYTLLFILLSFAYSYAQPPLPPTGYRWVLWDQYSDEFNGDSLDRSKWRDYYKGWEGRAPAKFDPSTISVQDGKLQIRNKKLKTFDRDYTIAGGAVQSLEKTAHFGYYEVKFKASKIAMSTTFWMSNGKEDVLGTTNLGDDCPNDKWSQELDIIESVGGEFNGSSKFRTQMNFNTHYRYINCQGAREKFYSAGNNAIEGNGLKVNASFENSESWEDYHTYGCYWKDDKTFDFYVDSRLAGTVIAKTDIVDAPFTRPMGINMVTETYDWATPYPTDEQLTNMAINASYYDWVRSYRLFPIFEPEDTGNNRNKKTLSNKSAIFIEDIELTNTPIFNKESGEITLGYTYKANVDREIEVEIYNTNTSGKKMFTTTITALEGYGMNTHTFTLDRSLYSENQKVVISLKPINGSKKNVIDSDFKNI